MSVALETVVKQLEDSGIVAAGKLENFIPPKAHPKSVEELVAQLVKGNHLTKFQAAQVAAGKSRSLILGEYTILNKIGAGGMGQVFKALHRRMDRLVAIKMLPPAMTKDAAAIARFEREVRAAAKLRHPNIVAADDAGHANGVHFLVMEYVDGQDLSQLVKKNGPFPVAKAVNYVLQAARGLEFAHSEGVVHRDIKPANLLLDKKGTVKILDMGLARIESQGNGAAQAELTGTGAIMGTVDYMAPEQGMSTKHADARADIYSLGCSLYYLIAGKATYDGETMAAKLVAHHTHVIPDLRSVQADVTDDLEAVFKKMVAKRLEDRYQSMTEVISDLDRLGRNSGTVNDPYAATAALRSGAMAARKGNDVSPSGGKQPPWKNTKVLIGAGAAGFLFLLLGVWVIIRDKDGNEVARVQVPEGGTATVQTPAPPKTADTPKTTVPATPTVPPPAPTTTATTAPAAVPPPQPTSKTAGNQPTVASPLAGYALEFDGTDNYVDIPSLQLVKGEPRTVEFWISNCGPSPRHRVFDMLGDGASLALDFVPHPAPSDQASWTVFGKTSAHPNTGFYSATQPIPGAPQHIAVAFDNQSVHPTLFMNGKRLDGPKKGFGFKLPSSMGTVLGGHRGDDGKFDEFFNGRMHQVRVSRTVRYSREFTPPDHFEPDADTLALYHFDEGAGDVLKDSSGNGHHGKIVGAKWVKADGSPITPPSQRHSLTFYDGNAVELPKLPLTATAPFTLEVWAGRNPKFAEWPGAAIGVRGVGELGSAGKHQGWSFGPAGGRTPARSAIGPNSRVHLAGVFTGKESLLFVDGKLVDRKPASPFAGAKDARQGEGLIGYNWLGAIDQVRVSNSVRYDQDFMPEGVLQPDKDTVALYRFDEGTGDVLKDSSGNGHHGKIVLRGKWVKVDGAPIAPQSAIGLAPPIAMAPFNAAQAKAHQEAWAKYLGEPVETTNSIGMKLVVIPRGKLTMGSPSTEKDRGANEKQVTVTLSKDFWLGQTEVTNAQWKLVMGSVPSRWKDDDRPVEQVSWDDAMEFCRKLSALPEEKKAGRVYRLPTEVEWEYACRAGTKTAYSFGDDESLGDYGWFDKNSDGQTHPVGKKQSNAWGLHDMHGNVWEWCSDWQGDYPNGAVTDPQDPPTGSLRVLRGGSCRNSAWIGRSTNRNSLLPSSRLSHLGFRLALSPSGAESPEAAPSPSPAPAGVPKLLTTLKNNLGPGGMAFSGDGNNVIADGWNLTFFDALTGNVLHQEFKEKTLVTALSRAADGKTLAYSGVGGDAFFTRVLELPSRKKIAEFSPKYVQLSGALSPDGKTLVYGDEAGLMFRDVLESRAEVAIKAVKDRLFTALKYSPDGQFVAGVYFDNSNHGKETQLVILDAKTRVQIAAKDLEGMSDWSDISKDSKRVVVATKMVGKPAWHLFSLPEGNLIHTERDLPAPCFAGAFSPDSAHLALGFFDGSVQIWDAATKKVILSWNATQHVDPKNKARAVVAVAFSPDGKTLATACNPDIHLWDLTKATTGTEPKP